MSSRPNVRLALLALLCAGAANAAPRTFEVDSAASTAEAHVGKTGLASFAGHEHLVVAKVFSGQVVFDDAAPGASTVALTIDASSLKVSTELEPEGDAVQVEERMRSATVLDIAKFATIGFKSTAVSGKQTGPGKFDLSVTGAFSLHGVSKAFTVPVTLALKGNALTASGSMEVKQTDFGITPTTAAGGMVKVEDTVVLTFAIVAKVKAP